METINTPYDDTFRTLLLDCPELVVPLINELFGTNYTGREVVVSNENEIFFRNPEGKKEKRVTDSNLTLISLKGISKRYHLECQSTADGTMEIRMWEYDAQIALRNKEYRDGVLYVNFPDSAVIYLRSNSNTPDELKICICVGKKEIFYEIPILKVKNYTLNEIFEKQLWMLIPRVTIEKSAFPVILPDQRLKILIFNHGIRKPFRRLPDQRKNLPHIKRLATVGRAAAPIAVADYLIKCGCPPHILCHCFPLQKPLHLLKFCRRKIVKCQLQFFCYLLSATLPHFQKAFNLHKLIPAVQRQKTQHLQKLPCPVFYTPVKVDQVCIVVIKHFHHTLVRFFSKQYPAATTKNLNIAVIFCGHHPINGFPQRFFTAYP